ncbi:MAG: Uma2 family endonuclease [Leptolyngbya foveolarum]|uniref:Uma2 family endonuclease n=1 Tax=Leptolyngbya foveolarum TaxID=47253 RepID=A0A2W4UJ30_9CYAN|nr:MAG: Uma2 family endonuclease [Leptolyngbya foveolarum]
MRAVKTQVLTDCWVSMAWDEYVTCSEEPSLKSAKCYYHEGHGRFEMLPVGPNHAKDHTVANDAIKLFCILKFIPITVLDNASYRKAGCDECQPDLSAYVGDKANKVPSSGGFINLDLQAAPDLAIEVANTSFLDDIGAKRSLYETLNISEYWIVNVAKAEVTAFEILNQGSQRIATSKLLKGFEFSVLEEALRRSRKTDQSKVGNWLMQQFQS